MGLIRVTMVKLGSVWWSQESNSLTWALNLCLGNLFFNGISTAQWTAVIE